MKKVGWGPNYLQQAQLCEVKSFRKYVLLKYRLGLSLSQFDDKQLFQIKFLHFS